MSDYLWDRSGEPDEEIQKLEEILAPLGYQPRPLEIPATVVPEHRRRFFPAIAIAATIALAALALGLWLTINRDQSQPLQAKEPAVQTPNKDMALPLPPPEKSEEVAAGDQRQSNQGIRHTPLHKPASRSRRSNPIERQAGPQTIASRRVEAEANEAEAAAAKEQLITALRLVSTKLNHAQKRAQGGHPGNLIRNQHKVG